MQQDQHKSKTLNKEISKRTDSHPHEKLERKDEKPLPRSKTSLLFASISYIHSPKFVAGCIEQVCPRAFWFPSH